MAEINDGQEHPFPAETERGKSYNPHLERLAARID